jgi:excinuclease ABC subunit A
MDVVKRADWDVEHGPEAGDGGGRLVAQGTHEEVPRVEASQTGRYLRPLLPEPAAATALAG